MSEYVIIMTTIDSDEKAKELAGSLVRDRLVACAQRTRIDSTYEWEGKINDDAEYLILFKTNARNQEKVLEAVKDRHSYDEPEIIVVPILGGSAGYLGWIDSVTN